MSSIRKSGTYCAAMISIATISTAFLLAGPAAAQEARDQATVAAQEDATQVKSRRRVDEITVTARKVEESLKDVPLSITAFDATMIEEARIRDMQDVADLTPGLSFFNAFGENLPIPVIRGVAQTNIFGEGNAAVFVDGVFVSAQEGLNFSQLDIERIEVVKGPQSALYGRTAFSGALNYVTKRPAEEFESRVDVEAGNRGKQRGSVMVSGPIFSQKLRGRIAALYDEWDGSYNNSLAPENDIGGYRYRSFQGSLVWEPTDNLEFYWSGYSSNDEIDDVTALGVSTNCENRIDDNEADVRFLNVCGEVPRLVEAPSPGPGAVDGDSLPVIARALGEDRDLLRSNLNINWDLNFGTFTSLTGFTNTKQGSLTDFGHLGNMPFLFCSGATIEGPGVPNSCGSNPANEQFNSGVLNFNLPGESEEWSQELRFTSPQDRRFRYSVGAYGFRSTSKGATGGILNQSPLPNGGVGIGLPPFDPSAPNLAIGTAIFYCSFTDDGCADPLKRVTGRGETSSWAVFTGLDFDFTDRLTGRFEIRYSETDIKSKSLRYELCTPTGLVPECGDDWLDLRVVEPLPFEQGGSSKGGADFDSISGRLGLDFKINDGWMMYASFANGEKPGGIQLASLNVVTPAGNERENFTHTFDTEVLYSYELGLKGRTEDGRIGFDTAVFYNDWQDIVLRQIVEVSPLSGRRLEQPTAFNFNAGTAEVFGFEMTTDVVFTDDLTGRFTMNWQDSTLTDAAQDTFESFPDFAPDGDVSGNKLLRQPEWMGSVSLTYARSLWGNWEGSARADANWQDKVFVGNDNQSWLSERTVLNMTLLANTPRFSISLWARNLLNNDEPAAAFRDIFWSNTSSQTPPFDNLGPRPSFDKFVPLRYTVSYPRLRTFGITATMRFGAAAN